MSNAFIKYVRQWPCNVIAYALWNYSFDVINTPALSSMSCIIFPISVRFVGSRKKLTFIDIGRLNSKWGHLILLACSSSITEKTSLMLFAISISSSINSPLTFIFGMSYLLPFLLLRIFLFINLYKLYRSLLYIAVCSFP